MTATPPLASSRRPVGLGSVLRLASVAFVTLAWVAMGAATPALAATDMSQCRTIDDPTARLRCYESFASPEPQLPPSSSPISGPVGSQSIGNAPGSNAESTGRQGGHLHHAARRLSGSDPNFVGLMIRCAEPDIEVFHHAHPPRSAPVLAFPQQHKIRQQRRAAWSEHSALRDVAALADNAGRRFRVSLKSTTRVPLPGARFLEDFEPPEGPDRGLPGATIKKRARTI